MGGKRKRLEGAGSQQRAWNKTTNESCSMEINKRLKRSTRKEGKDDVTLPSKQTTAAKVTVVANSNWMARKRKIQQMDQRPHPCRKLERKRDLDVNALKQRLKQEKEATRRKAKTAEWVDNSRIIAMDCEMVGVGLSGKNSVLARCSIVDYDGNVLYDKFVRPVEKVTDFRTHVSGIQSRTLRTAIPFAQCIQDVGKLMKDKIIVGHALKNDFQALMFTAPRHLIRDTAYYRPYMRRKQNGTKLYPKSLKNLVQEVLGKQIQTGTHDSVEDARAALELYKHEQFAWEKYLHTSRSKSLLVGLAPSLPIHDDMPMPLSSTAVRHLDSDDDAMRCRKRGLTIPDSHELAIMEYGE
ncbi:hypothetical protein PsorP6_003104 [Peronosclerospora sorghi]|uniref:Uncharacterized protein n=1 Tax=Peronosclerospora sorghi TaxID=230839 RepID=A0ACC0VM19_9STRA|nr:hypothetical protein PsorP6_003104 [Peronosclerospora sorghi]